MNKTRKILLTISGITIIRSVYFLCLIISIIIRTTALYRLFLLLLIGFIVFENYCILSCLLKQKNLITVELEINFICLVYIFSIGYTLSHNSSVNIFNLLITFFYTVCLELYKILYLKEQIKEKYEKKEKLNEYEN